MGKVELGGKAYDFLSLFNGRPAATMVIYQSPGSNAIEVTNQLLKTLEELKKNFPPGIEDPSTL